MRPTPSRYCSLLSRERFLCPKERGDPAECSSQDAQIRILLDREEERILAECQAEINRHEFQLKNFNDEINSFFMNNYCSKIWNYVKLIRKVSVKCKN